MGNIFTLCVIKEDDKIVVQKRNKPPFVGLWNAPGGKVEHMETPIEACTREVLEETGLFLTDIKLRGVLTVSSITQQSKRDILMLFESQKFEGDIISSIEEGEISWVEVDQIYSNNNVSDSFCYILPYIIESDGIITGKFVYEKSRLKVCDISVQVV